jgi:hypothetical protein
MRLANCLPLLALAIRLDLLKVRTATAQLKAQHAMRNLEIREDHYRLVSASDFLAQEKTKTSKFVRREQGKSRNNQETGNHVGTTASACDSPL